MSWTIFDSRSDFIMSVLALLCLFLGILLLITPCFENSDTDDQEKEAESQDLKTLTEDDDLKKNLLADYC